MKIHTLATGTRCMRTAGDLDVKLIVKHDPKPRMAPIVTFTNTAGRPWAIELSTPDVISLHEVLGILFNADAPTVSSWWRELTTPKPPSARRCRSISTVGRFSLPSAGSPGSRGGLHRARLTCQAAFEEVATHIGSAGPHVGWNVESPLPSDTRACSGFNRNGLVSELGSATAVACPAGVSIVISSPGSV